MSIPVVIRKTVLAGAGVLLAAWALFDPHLRNAEHLLSARACLPLALAVNCGLLALAAGGPWQRPVLWLTLLITGQAAALQLVQPTGHVGYQHYLTPAQLLSLSSLPCLLVLAAQFLLAGAALLPVLRTTWQRLVTGLRGWRLGLLAVLAFFAASAPSLNLLDYACEWLLAGLIQFTGLLTVWALVRSIPTGSLALLRERLLALDLLPDCDYRPQPGGIDRFALYCTLWVVTVSLLLSVFVYQRHPHIADEVVYLLHANYLAQGMLAMPVPPVPGAFDIDLMTMDQHGWFSAFPPGWPAMLALGSRFGVPWLVNPLLAGICVLLAYTLLREIASRGTARLGTLLLSVSPWFLFLAMSFMAHIFTLACVLGAALAIALLRRRGGAVLAVIAGVLLGITSLIRPLDGLAAALILGLWSLGIPTWRDRLRYIPLLVLATLAVGALVLPYNEALTGKATLFPVTAYFNQHYGVGSNDLGFGPNRGMDWRGLDPFPGHGLRDVVLNNYLNTFGTDTELFGWMTGSLLPVFLLFVSGRARRWDYRLALVPAIVAGLHSLYWFSGGPDFGARYWFLMLLPLLALTLRGGCTLAGLLPEPRHAMTQVVTALLALSLAAMVTFMPWRSIDKYFHYNDMRPDIRQLAQQYHFGNGLVLVRGKRFDDYMSAAVYNTPLLGADTAIYAWDRSPEIRKALVKTYHNRTIWLVDGPTLTGNGYRVVGGPYSASQLLQDGVAGQAGAP